jgi:ferredoxin
MTNPHAAAAYAAQAHASAALDALAPFEPVARVSYVSHGRLLVIGGDERVARACVALAETLSVAVLWTAGSDAPILQHVEVRRGRVESLTGYLGAFVLRWGKDEEALFDLVLDLQASPHFNMHQPPQGYWTARTEVEFAHALADLPESVGEFEKPKFFSYKESICAHSRSSKEGCHRCIDICSTKAIASAGDIVEVNPNLCMGCGACAVVCPTGAMRYQYPRVSDRGAQLRAMLGAYREAGGAQPVVVIVNANHEPPPLPANALALPAWHVASVGLDLMLGATAYGAAGVVVLRGDDDAPQYVESTQQACATGNVILNALGLAGEHFLMASAESLAVAVARVASAAIVTVPATFHLQDDKRATIEFSIEHFVRHTRPSISEVALAAPAMFGTVNVDRDKCTMCLACAGACPASALMDGSGAADASGAERPVLKFLERNCVQCGLCENTCPERAISLAPRLLLTPARKEVRVLNETEPFNCISCGAVLGTKKLIDTMLLRLTGHSMFAAEGALKRLQMCADCRVVDMMSNKNEMSVLTGKPLE